MIVKNLSRKNVKKTNEISSIGVLIMHARSREKMKKNKNSFDRRVFRFDKHT